MADDEHQTLLRILHYPGEAIREPAWLAAPHEDINFITLLYAPEGLVIIMGGVEIQIACVPGSYVVNIGEMFVMLCELLGVVGIQATTHAVRATGKRRLSYPFFAHPTGTTIVDVQGRTAHQILEARKHAIGIYAPLV